MKYNFPGSRVITFWKRPLADILGFLVDTKFRILEDVTLLDVVALNHQLGFTLLGCPKLDLALIDLGSAYFCKNLLFVLMIQILLALLHKNI